MLNSLMGCMGAGRRMVVQSVVDGIFFYTFYVQRLYTAHRRVVVIHFHVFFSRCCVYYDCLSFCVYFQTLIYLSLTFWILIACLTHSRSEKQKQNIFVHKFYFFFIWFLKLSVIKLEWFIISTRVLII